MSEARRLRALEEESRPEAVRYPWCRNPAIRGVGVIAAALLALGCENPRGQTDTQLHWGIERLWTVGGLSSSLSLSAVERFQVASDGDAIYLLARPEHRVFVLRADGIAVDTMGREGEGPGEFVDPWAITISEDREVAVVDPGTRRVVRWSSVSQVLDPIPIRDPLDHPKMAIQTGAMWFTVTEATGDGRAEYRLISRGAAGSTVIAALEMPPRKVGDFPSCRARGISVQPLFAPVLQWDLLDGKAAVNAGADYSIRLFDQDSLVTTFGRPISPERATFAAAVREAHDWRLNDCVVPPEEVVRATGYAERIPVVQAIAVAPGGEVWVLRRAEPPQEARIDLFSPAGSYLGTLPEGFPFPAAFLAGDRFVAVGKDSLDVPWVSLYAFRRSATGDQAVSSP